MAESMSTTVASMLKGIERYENSLLIIYFNYFGKGTVFFLITITSFLMLISNLKVVFGYFTRT